LDDLKDRALLLDYANIVETHFPDGDIYTPSVKVSGVGGGEGSVKAECPDCGYENEYGLRGDCKDYQLDKHGYCLDVFGEPVVTPHGPMPGHYGRRCVGLVPTGERGQYDRCGYFFTSKVCEACEGKNDIAARFCSSCKNELVDPNEKLVADFKAHKKDPSQVQTDTVINVEFRPGVSQKGNKTIRADWTTPHRRMSTWHLPEATHSKGMRDWALFAQYTDGGNSAPNTITYVKEDSGLYRVLAFDRAVDELEMTQ
jgi:DNA repair protein RadD